MQGRATPGETTLDQHMVRAGISLKKDFGRPCLIVIPGGERNMDASVQEMHVSVIGGAPFVLSVYVLDDEWRRQRFILTTPQTGVAPAKDARFLDGNNWQQAVPGNCVDENGNALNAGLVQFDIDVPPVALPFEVNYWLWSLDTQLSQEELEAGALENEINRTPMGVARIVLHAQPAHAHMMGQQQEQAMKITTPTSPRTGNTPADFPAIPASHTPPQGMSAIAPPPMTYAEPKSRSPWIIAIVAVVATMLFCSGMLALALQQGWIGGEKQSTLPEDASIAAPAAPAATDTAGPTAEKCEWDPKAAWKPGGNGWLMKSKALGKKYGDSRDTLAIHDGKYAVSCSNGVFLYKIDDIVVNPNKKDSFKHVGGIKMTDEEVVEFISKIDLCPKCREFAAVKAALGNEADTVTTSAP